MNSDRSSCRAGPDRLESGRCRESPRSVIPHAVAALAFVALLSSAHEARSQAGLDARPAEVAQLPTFCWAQLHVPNAEGDEFRIRDCGPGANHYCSGLLYLVRAKHARRKVDAVDGVRHADSNVAYTESAIKDSPHCSIRDTVASTRAEVNHLLDMYGAKRPKGR